MKKDLGVLEAVFPMPVLMIATYNEDGTAGQAFKEGAALMGKQKE